MLLHDAVTETQSYLVGGWGDSSSSKDLLCSPGPNENFPVHNNRKYQLPTKRRSFKTTKHFTIKPTLVRRVHDIANSKFRGGGESVSNDLYISMSCCELGVRHLAILLSFNRFQTNTMVSLNTYSNLLHRYITLMYSTIFWLKHVAING